MARHAKKPKVEKGDRAEALSRRIEWLSDLSRVYKLTEFASFDKAGMARNVKKGSRDRKEALSRRIERLSDLSRVYKLTGFTRQPHQVRRSVRSEYTSIQDFINERSYDIGNAESEKFKKILSDVESLFQNVTWPREQVVDAETILGLTNSVLTSVKLHLKGTITPSEFVSCFLKAYGRRDGKLCKNARGILPWKQIGLFVSPIFMDGWGCKTMIGPMDYEIKLEPVEYKNNEIKYEPLNYAIRLRRIRNEIKKGSRAYARPKKVVVSTAEWKSNTEKNVSAMFEAIKEQKSIKLENLILNRISYAQTIENIFALSFLVKDGKVTITVAKNGSHFVSSRDAADPPTVRPANAVYHNFIFRYDYKDWKVMLELVAEGEELMPHRAPP